MSEQDLRPTVTISWGVLQGVREAICQILDDGGYFNHNDEIYAAPDRTHGGGFCHAAALQLIESLTILDAVLSEGE